MNAYEELIKGIEWVLENKTSYQVMKDLGISNKTINRYQNGTTPIENMTMKTAQTIYYYYLREMRKVRKAIIESLNGKTFLIDMDEIEEKVNTDEAMIGIKGIKPTKELIEKLNAAAEGRMNWEELEEFLEEQGFEDFETESLDYYVDKEELLVYDMNIYEFYNLNDVETVQTYEWLAGTNREIEQIASLTEVVVDGNYVSLDTWDGRNFTFNNSTGRHARVYKVLESDYNTDDLYLVEFWSQWQGEHETGEVMSKEELTDFLKEHELDAEEIFNQLESEEE